MKVNMYYVVVGILSILFCFSHAWNGIASILPLVDASNLTMNIKTTVSYVWHIISVENFVFGAAFLVMAFHRDTAGTKFAAWLIAVIILARWAIIMLVTMLKDMAGLKDTLIDSAAIFVFVGLIIAGIKKDGRRSLGTGGRV